MLKVKEFLRQFRYLPRVLRLVWHAAPVWTTAWAILLVVQSLIPFFTVLATRASVNQIMVLLSDGFSAERFSAFILPFSELIVLIVGGNVIDGMTSWVRLAQSEYVRDAISNLIHLQAARIDMSYYEDSKFHDLFYRVRVEARSRPLMLLENVGVMVKSLISTVSLGVLLATYGWWLLPLLGASGTPALWIILRFNRRQDQWRRESTTRERRTFYYDMLLTDLVPAAEMRAFDLSTHYMSIYKDLRRDLRNERLKLWRDKTVADLLTSIFEMLVGGGVLAWMGWRVLIGVGTVGDLVAFYQIFSNVQAALGAISGRVGDIYQSMLFLQDLFVYLDLQPRMQAQAGQPVLPLQRDIRFEHVSFSYPNSERDALDDFSVTIPAGKVVALVGENGEGKTTLTKLIGRFYDPKAGRVLWDGVDLRDLSVHDLRRQIAMQFQAPYYYPESAFNNIAVGDIERNLSLDDVNAAARDAMVHDIVMQLPQQYATVLGKWFGGEELSVGQWQRLALARALVRKASVIILDEPTSAMDAWAESEWMHHIREIAQARTMIIITHRFTTAMQADLILLMRNKQIVEQGSHSELLARGGIYEQLWEQQMREAGATSLK